MMEHARKRNQLVAQHAAADLAVKGVWTCQCPPCKECRAETILVARLGYCRNCGNVIRRQRKSARFCSDSCRSGYFQRMKRKAVRAERGGMFAG
jgi:hypothetical protein